MEKKKNNPKGADRDPMKINNKTFDNFNYNSADIKKNSKLKFKHFNYEQNGRAYFVWNWIFLLIYL